MSDMRSRGVPKADVEYKMNRVCIEGEERNGRCWPVGTWPGSFVQTRDILYLQKNREEKVSPSVKITE